MVLGVRSRTVVSVIAELKILKFEDGVGHIVWLGDDFLYKRHGSLLFFNEVIKENLNMTLEMPMV